MENSQSNSSKNTIKRELKNADDNQKFQHHRTTFQTSSLSEITESSESHKSNLRDAVCNAFEFRGRAALSKCVCPSTFQLFLIGIMILYCNHFPIGPTSGNFF